MGREIRRVPKEFDWPIGKIWPGFTMSVCRTMDTSIGKDLSREQRCGLCKKWAKLSGFPVDEGEFGCPDLSSVQNPPEGDYYQLWNTTTEGHPMSPPCKTPEELARWLVDNKASAVGFQTASYEEWLAFIKGPGWAPSMIVTEKGITSGVAGLEK